MAHRTQPIVVIEDEEECRTSYCTILELEGAGPVTACGDGRRALDLLARAGARVVLLDLMMPHVTGLELLPRITANHPEVPVIVITGNDDTETVVQCMKNGAYDYLVKPISKTRLVTTVQQAMDFRLLNQEIDSLRSSLRERAGTLELPQAFDSIITADREMVGLFRYLERIADSRANLLIEGETGTGKELFARAGHDLSGRTGPFVAVNVAGLDDTAFSDTLFGHVRGAYTGADDKRAGMLAAAREGTLLLDEVGDLGMTAQVKLLRLLQSGEYYPLGSDVVQHADARIIAASNESLADKCRAGAFRKDLYYRLCTHRVSIPPLRERRADLERLVPHFVEQAAADAGCSTPGIPPEIYLLLANYSFPGNVRELQSMIINAVSSSAGPVLSLRSLQKHVGASIEQTGGDAECPVSLSDASVLPTISQMKQRLISEALRRTAGNQSQAAALIGVTQQTISRHLRKEF